MTPAPPEAAAMARIDATRKSIASMVEWCGRELRATLNTYRGAIPDDCLLSMLEGMAAEIVRDKAQADAARNAAEAQERAKFRAEAPSPTEPASEEPERNQCACRHCGRELVAGVCLNCGQMETM